MASPAQIAANRRNAKKSTGPRTPKGKAVCRENAVTHGLTSNALLLPGEDPEAFQALLADLQARFQPSGPLEENLVLHIAAAHWRLDRALPMETQLYSHLSKTKDSLCGDAFLADCEKANSLSKLARYQAALDRSIDRSLRLLKAFQDARAAAAPKTEITKQTQFHDPATRPISSPSHISSVVLNSRPTEITKHMVDDFDPGPGALLYIAIAGTGELDYSQVSVRHHAHLDGMLALSLIDGYIPPAGTAIPILTAEKITGCFSSIRGALIDTRSRFVIRYSPTEVAATVVTDA